MVRLLTPDSSVEWCSPMVSGAVLHLSYCLSQNLRQMSCKDLCESCTVSGITPVLSGTFNHYVVIWFVSSSRVGLEWRWCICEGADIISLQGVLWNTVFGRHRALLYTGKHRVPPAKPCYWIHEKGKLVTISCVNTVKLEFIIHSPGKFWLSYFYLTSKCFLD